MVQMLLALDDDAADLARGRRARRRDLPRARCRRSPRWRRDRAPPRHGRGADARRARARRQRRRLPRRRDARACCAAQTPAPSSRSRRTCTSARTRCSSTASPTPPSASCSRSCSPSTGSGRRSRSRSSPDRPPAELRRAIALGDHARFQAIPGIGKKTAERIVLELKEKVVAAADAPSQRAGDGARSPRRARRARRARLHASPRPSSASPASIRSCRPQSASGWRCGRRRMTSQASGMRAVGCPVSDGVVDPVLDPEDEELERSLRPRRLDDFVGQERVKEQLAISLEAAKARGEALDHVLLVGPPGLGKTTLAQIIRRRARRRPPHRRRPGAREEGRSRRSSPSSSRTTCSSSTRSTG